MARFYFLSVTNEIDNMDKINKYAKILLPASEHCFEKDRRFLIPFVQGTLIGFVNKEKEVVIPPKFDMVLDDFDSKYSKIRIGKHVPQVIINKNGHISKYVYKQYGLLDSEGNLVIPIEYSSIAKPHYESNETYTVKSLENEYAVLGSSGEEIVPFGKYDYIDGFEEGYARVKIGSSGSLCRKGDKWGLIDESGKEILPVEYNRIDKFYLKNVRYTVVEKDGVKQEFHLMEGELTYEGAYEDELRRLKREDEDYRSLCEYRDSQDYYDDSDMRDSWDAMTDGMYGDMPDGFDGDYDFLGR